MKTTRLIASLAVTALAAFADPANAAPGDLDLTFGGTGKVITAVGVNAEGRSVAVQGDGKIVVAGFSWDGINTAFALVRYNIDGSLDTSFNGSGKVTTVIGTGDDEARSVAVQNDGKIVVAGHSFNGSNLDIAVVRYLANGSLDTTFGGTGKVTTAIGSGDDYARSVGVQENGRIVVAGGYYNGSNIDFALVRYLPNGNLDTSFGGTGKVTTAIGIATDDGYALALQSDGKIVVSGTFDDIPRNTYDFAVIRYNVDGSLDTSFGDGGKVITDFGSVDASTGVAVQGDGKIVAVGRSNPSNPDFYVARYNADGSLDANFGGTGKVITDFGHPDFAFSLAIQSDARIVVVGTSQTSANSYVFALARYNSNGNLDTTFNGNGKVTTAIGGSSQAFSVAVQSDGRIVAAGTSYNGSNLTIALARYGDADTDGDGIPDKYETGTGIYVSPTDTGTNPNNPDSDGDGLTDGQEVNTYHSNPNIADTDGDGFDDGFEVSTGFSPTSATSTPDALSSIRTAAEYRFNAANGISYRIEASTDLTNWTTIETNIIGTGGVITRFYSIEGQPRRFFRSRRN